MHSRSVLFALLNLFLFCKFLFLRHLFHCRFVYFYDFYFLILLGRFLFRLRLFFLIPLRDDDLDLVFLFLFNDSDFFHISDFDLFFVLRDDLNRCLLFDLFFLNSRFLLCFFFTSSIIVDFSGLNFTLILHFDVFFLLRWLVLRLFNNLWLF